MSSFRTSLIVCGLAAAAFGIASLFNIAPLPGPFSELVASWLVAMGLGMAGWGAWPREQTWTGWRTVRLCCVLLPLVMLSLWLPVLALNPGTWPRMLLEIAGWSGVAGLGLAASNLVLGFVALVVIALRDHRGTSPGVHGWWAAAHFLVLPFNILVAGLGIFAGFG